MKRRFSSIALLLLAVQVFGQGIPKGQSLREWDKGPLQKTEFLEAARGDTAFFSCVWFQKHVRVKTDKITAFHYTDVQNIFLPFTSVICGDEITEEQLQTFQKEFDLSEFYARELRDTLVMLPGWRRKEAQKRVYAEFLAQRNTFSDETGLIPTLDPDDFDVTLLPRVSPLGFAVHAGAVASCPLGDMSGLSGPSFGMVSGVEISYGRFYVTAEYYDCKGSYKSDYIGVGEAPSVSQSGWRVGPGIVFVRTDRMRFSTFMTSGHSRVSSNQEIISGPSLTEGIRCDFCLRRAYRLDGVSALYQAGIGSRLYLGQIWVSQNRTFSPSVNLSLSLNISRNGLSRN